MKSNKHQWCIVVWLGIGLLLAAGPAPAQEGAGEIGDGEGDYRNHELAIPPNVEISAWYYVGADGSNNVITIDDGGSFAQTRAASAVSLVIGRYVGGDHNRIVVNQGGVLENVTALAHVIRIGGRNEANQGGSYNELVVDGGAVTNFNIWVGDGPAGTGSVLRVINDGLVDSPGNVIIASRGGAVGNQAIVSGTNSRILVDGYFSAGNIAGAHDNRVLVEDGGTIQAATYSRIGRAGTNNVVTVTNAGTYSVGTYLELGGEPDGTHTLMTVDDSTVTVGTYLQVGNEGTDNRLLVNNAGEVNVSGELTVGAAASSVRNEMEVAGEARVAAGDLVRVGQAGSQNAVTVSGGGVLSAGSDTGIIIGELEGSDHNKLTVGPGGTVVSVSEGANRGIRVGGSGPQGGSYGEVLVDGGLITNFVIRLGDGTGSTGNVLQVINGGRIYSPSYVMTGSRGGTEENLLVVSGATSRVEAGSYFSLGNLATAPNNETRVQNEGALQTETFAWVGRASSDNRMFVSAGGIFDIGTSLFVGQSVGADDTLLEVDGDGSRISAGGDVTVGVSDRNILRVQNEGLLRTAADATIGAGAAADNEVIVTGTGSLWTNEGSIAVSPDGGADNALRVRDAGLVLSGSLGVGANGELEVDDATAGVADTLMVDADGRLTFNGTGAKIRVGAGAMTVANDFSANRLLVADGGTVTANGALDLGAGGELIVEEGAELRGAPVIQGNAHISGVFRPSPWGME